MKFEVSRIIILPWGVKAVNTSFDHTTTFS